MHYWAVECEERMKLWKVDRISGLMFDEAEEEVDIVQMLHRAYLRTKYRRVGRKSNRHSRIITTVGTAYRECILCSKMASKSSWVIQGRLSFEGISSSSVPMKNSIGMTVLIKSAQIQQIPP